MSPAMNLDVPAVKIALHSPRVSEDAVRMVVHIQRGTGGALEDRLVGLRESGSDDGQRWVHA